MSRKAHFFRQIRESLPYKINFDASNNDHISLTNHLTFSGVFDWEFKFSFSAESSGYAPIFGTNVDQSRVLVSQTNSKIIVNLGDNSSIIYTYPFLFNTTYVLRLRRDSSSDVYMNVNGSSDILLGNRTGTFGAPNASSTYLGRVASRYLTGWIEYANIGGDYDFQLNEGSGSTVTSETNNQTATIQTTQNINYINNTMWEEI